MSPLKFNFTKPGWKVLKDTKVFETPIFNLHKREVKPADGSPAGDFYILDHICPKRLKKSSQCESPLSRAFLF